ncbi:Spy/CpxP family protein refolding chaperone [Devosia sp. A16]|uniref:Spy/CpxP family protein refolding chaperone n=1 Tax=Devosia sp. A16 TaxID=1736675 RepID=UPI0006D83529|nr:Spy/CpxP family protein refolding chaperone [Devosia sp. A16]
MTPTRATILAALVAALGLTAMSPVFAAGPERPRSDSRTLEFRRDAGGAFRFVDFSCNSRAADRLERRLDRMAGKLKLSKDQEKLFEDFRTSALTAQTDFADRCDTIRPGTATNDRQRPDLIQRLEQRLKFDEARVAAMTELLPQFRSFYESLTDNQKRELAPRRHMQGKMLHPGQARPHHSAPAAPGLDG